MKIALYIEDGLEQIVLTPESDTEKGILGKMHDGSRELNIKKGSFFSCQGGWIRHGVHFSSDTFGRSDTNDESTMIILKEKPKGDGGPSLPPGEDDFKFDPNVKDLAS